MTARAHPQLGLHGHQSGNDSAFQQITPKLAKAYGVQDVHGMTCMTCIAAGRVVLLTACYCHSINGSALLLAAAAFWKSHVEKT